MCLQAQYTYRHGDRQGSGPEGEDHIITYCDITSGLPSRSLLHRYVLTLITDGMRSVRAFHFDKAAASVLTTCVSEVGCGTERQRYAAAVEVTAIQQAERM